MRWIVSARRAGSSSRPGGGGQRLLVGPRQAVGGQGVFDRPVPDSRRPAATGNPPGRPAPTGPTSPGPPAATRPAVGRLGLVRLARRFEEGGDGGQAPADVDLAAGSAPGSAASASGGPAPPGVPPARPPSADLPVSSASSKFDAAAPAARPVGLLAEQGAELAVEVGGRLQEPVAQLLELVLLEQEILADAGVERLDGVDRQLVPLLDAGVGGAEVGVGLRLHGDDSGRAADESPGPRPPTGPRPPACAGTRARPARRGRPAGPRSAGCRARRRRSSASAWAVGVPPPRVLLQALQADRLQVAGHRRVEPPRRLGRRVPHRVERLHHASRRRTGPGRSAARRGRPPGRRRRWPW